MLTDVLSNGGMNVPHIEGPAAKKLLSQLFPGSSVSNPIDFLATGTAQQLGTIIDYCETRFDAVDGMAVIFGTPGLNRVFDVYAVLDEKMKTAVKPIFPILPSILTAAPEIDDFISRGRIFFRDEVVFGNALTRVYNTHRPFVEKSLVQEVDHNRIRNVINQAKDGYISPSEIRELLDASGIRRAGEAVVATADDAVKEAKILGFPVVMKVVGPVHKSDVGGVAMNVKDEQAVTREFERMIQINDTTAVLIQPMLSGTELFVGAKYEPKFGHMILCGLGGIFIEVLKDVAAGLAPLGMEEALFMIRSLKSYQIIKGVRGQKGVNEKLFAEVILKLSALLMSAPEIMELDFNPLLGKEDSMTIVDARINLKKN
jgi:acetyltransferase